MAIDRNNQKKILFVGDLRTANNYGAIATTETLINLLTDREYNLEIKYIDYRSFYNPTPPNGWQELKTKESSKTKLKRYIKKVTPSFLIGILKPTIRSKKIQILKDFVPFKFSLYDDFYTGMSKGTILQYEKKLLEWADIVYINGEGNIVNGTDEYGKYRKGGLYILFIAWLAKIKFNKTTCIVNHTVDPANEDVFYLIEKIYPLLDLVYVRETLSINKLRSIGINNAVFVPDALFGYTPLPEWKPTSELNRQIDFSQPFICIGDSSGIRNAYNRVKWDVFTVYKELIIELKKISPQIIFVDGFNNSNEDINKVVKELNIGYVNMSNCSYHDLFYVLKSSQIFISGRWHASILSVLAGTPILLWGSDSHKTRSLYTLLEYPYPFYEVNTLPIHIKDMTQSVQEIINEQTSIKYLFEEKLAKLTPRAKENATFLKQI